MKGIKRQLNAILSDTSKRGNRVQEGVNLKLGKQHQNIQVVGWRYYATITAFISLIAFCIYLIPFGNVVDNVSMTELEPPLTVPAIEDVDEKLALEKGDYYEILRQYFFPDGSKATFLGGFENGGVKIETTWLDDHYVRQNIINDGGNVERIYRLKDNHIEIVYEEMADGVPRIQWTIEKLNKLPVKEILFEAPFEVGNQYGDWSVIETSGEVTTTYGSFSDVLILECADNENNRWMRRYYVRGFGEVKWEFAELNKGTGEYEVILNTDLSTITPSVLEEKSMSLFESDVETNYEPNSHSEWKKSPEGLKQATIAGRGELAEEEGEAVLVIENFNTNESVIYKLKDNIDGQYTPKYVEWIDENRLFVIVGFAHGTVTRGGQLYEMNIKEYTTVPVLEDLKENEEIMDIKGNGEGKFTYRKHVYDDEYYSEGHIEEETITVPYN
ncbi:DUF4652 domain-containing protein [Bacillus sp. FJAT-22090]|uniref:DUF4652 domain-containing protein n=1 Tax=Bacillus sp. FJAT-22090 TaxID=1581038 RepID=UPI0006ADAE43|nr:DUF4652 domain-containing protein [Bacillus sp. FJAT-22090]